MPIDKGIVGANPVNQSSAKEVRTRSTFQLNYHLFDTHRFGEIHPHFVMDSVAGDKISLRSSHNVRSFTLGAPLMQNIRMNKDYFAVPMEAIMPNTWSQIFTNPTLGDDVPDDANCTIDMQKFFELFKSIKECFKTITYNDLCNEVPPEVEGDEPTYVPDKSKVLPYLNLLFKSLCLYENVFSNGSLLSSLGCHLSEYFSYLLLLENRYTDFDSIYDKFVSEALFNFFDSNDLVYSCGSVTLKTTSSSDSIRKFLCYIREYSDFTIDDIDIDTESLSYFVNQVVIAFFSNFYLKDVDFKLNISRPIAYQLVCSHYFSNDSVDFIYSAELFRNNLFSNFMDSQVWGVNQRFEQGWYPDISTPKYFNAHSFDYNGLTLFYDIFAEHFTNVMFDYFNHKERGDSLHVFTTDFVSLLGNYDEFIDQFNSTYGVMFNYLNTILSYRPSLRYLDYFTGSKPRPLAVGDVNVPVEGGTDVNIIDVTRNIQKQRFLNAVNRSGRKFSSYLRDIFGTSPAPDYHNPFFLGHTSDVIFGQETENTGDIQFSEPNSISSVLRSNGSKYEFSFDSDRPCIIIGVTSYDLARSYAYSIERNFFHKDRFDMFNPFFQFIGDQKVYKPELYPENGSNLTPIGEDDIFGYQIRNSEYKQRYNQAAGGFVSNLPGYSFISRDVDRNSLNAITISPDFIRSMPFELDKFYLSLTGYSLASYFHFIVDNSNDCSASRPMAFTPNIL